MDKKLSENLPIYMQIMDAIRGAIVSGELKPGEKIPSVRDLAEKFQVNPNTMQRALAELEREGLLETERRNGRFVTDDNKAIEELRDKMGEMLVAEFIEKMNSLGFSKEEIDEFFRSDKILNRISKKII